MAGAEAGRDEAEPGANGQYYDQFVQYLAAIHDIHDTYNVGCVRA